MGLDGKPVEMYIRPDAGTFNQIIIITPPGTPGNFPIKIPSEIPDPAEPFIITDIFVSNYQYGTSCGNPTKWLVYISFTGNPAGHFIDFYVDDYEVGSGFVLWVDTLSPYSTQIIPQSAYFSKPNSLREIQFRVEETGNPSNVVTSTTFSIEGVSCGA